MDRALRVSKEQGEEDVVVVDKEEVEENEVEDKEEEREDEEYTEEHKLSSAELMSTKGWMISSSSP